MSFVSVGLRAILNVVAAAAITSVHIVLGLTTLPPSAALVFLGICYSIYASALWFALYSHCFRFNALVK